MRKIISKALLLFAFTFIVGCTGGTQTCIVTGLSPGTHYQSMKIATETW